MRKEIFANRMTQNAVFKSNDKKNTVDEPIRPQICLNEDFDFFETDENTPKELLNHGMDVNACGGFEQNALRTQALSFDVCRYLIGQSIDVNQRDNSGRTPLFRNAHNSEITKKPPKPAPIFMRSASKAKMRFPPMISRRKFGNISSDKGSEFKIRHELR